MSAIVEFQAPTEFLGRNGQAKMAAILVDRLDDDITLVPITTRRRMGRAYLLVPMEWRQRLPGRCWRCPARNRRSWYRFGAG